MTDENKADQQVDEQPKAEPHGEAETQHETDWKAEARKWEQRAKENKSAADELEALKQSQLTEQQKAEQRAERAESELAALKAEKQHATDAREVAEKTGAPLSMLECCTDRDAMEKLAKAYADEQQKLAQTPAAPKARPSRVVRDAAPVDNRDIFAQFMNDTFTKR